MYECTCACASTLFICKLKGGGGVLYMPICQTMFIFEGWAGGGGGWRDGKVRKNAKAQKPSSKFLGGKFSRTYSTVSI
jgi:hypothetical protein